MTGFATLSRTMAPACSPMLRLAILFALFAVGLVGTSCGSFAPQHRGIDDPIPSLRIGTSGDYPPFSEWPADDRAPRGFSADLARAYAGDSGRPIDWVRFRWANLEADLAAGRFDVVLSGVTVRPDRSIAGRFSVPLTTSAAVVLVRADGGLRAPSDLERPGLRLAVNAGGHLERTARARLPDATIEPVPENAGVLDRLDDPGVDGVVTDTLEAPRWLVRRAGLRAIGPLTRDRKAAWWPAGAREERIRFDAWLLRAERSGQLAALRVRHGLPPERTAAPRAALLARIDERLSLMPAVAEVKRVLGSPVEDAAREARVLEAAVAAVEAAAREAGEAPPPRAAVRALYRAQIEAAKEIQRAVLDAAARADAGGPAAPSEDARQAARARLVDAIRPALLDLGDGIARALVEARATSTRPGDDPLAPLAADVDRALAARGLSAPRRAAIASALEAVLIAPADDARAAPFSSSTASAPAPPRQPAARDTAPSA